MSVSTTLKISFDAKKVKAGLATMKSDFKQIGGAMKKIATIGAGIAVAIAAAGVAIGATVLKINEIGEAATSTDNKLKNITKQMGIFGDEAGIVSQRLLDLADAEERMTGTDTIVSTQAKLMTFKELAKSADEAGGAFDRATMAAIDMAAAGFGEAETNAVQLGKALNDPIKGINSLTRSGITFTQAEKDKIAVMVKSNQIIKAQDMILKAIETQVGGTARATATASGKIKQSFNQIVEAFAIPFSEGFSTLPDALEGVFPSIIAKATSIGKLIGTSISEAIAGDFTKFIYIGELIGEAISVGLKTMLKVGVENAIVNQVKWTEKFTLAGSSKKVFGTPMPSDLIGKPISFAQAFRETAANSSLDARMQALKMINETSQTNAPNQRSLTTKDFPWASSDKTSSEALKQIERNTRSGAKF